jgi:hypothetical protein
LQFKTSSEEETLRWITMFGAHDYQVNILLSPSKQHQQHIYGSLVKKTSGDGIMHYQMLFITNDVGGGQT